MNTKDAWRAGQRKLELAIEQNNVAFAKAYDILVTKATPVGWPDRVYWLKGGRPLLVEYKRPGGRLSPLQIHYAGVLQGLGYDYEIVDDADYGRALLEPPPVGGRIVLPAGYGRRGK